MLHKIRKPGTKVIDIAKKFKINITDNDCFDNDSYVKHKFWSGVEKYTIKEKTNKLNTLDGVCSGRKF